MTDETILNERLASALKIAVEQNFRIIESLALDETMSPKLLLFNDGQVQKTISFTVLTNEVDENSERIKFARKQTPSRTREYEFYVLSYYTSSNGEKTLELIIEAGEQGIPIDYSFAHPFKRDSEGKVIRLSDKPILRALVRT